MPSSTDWARTIGTTTVNYLRQEELAMLRSFKIFALLEGSGNVLMNQGGRGIDWQVQFRNQPVTGNTGETPRIFARQNLWVDAQLPYRGYQTTDMIYRKELKENTGAAALVQVGSKMQNRLTTSLKQFLSKEIYTDGEAVGNETRFHGMESFGSVNGTVNISTGAQRAANAADMFGFPNDTYATINTGLGAIAGSQQPGVSWPNGQADPEYDFYSPIVINYTSTAFKNGGSSYTWFDNCTLAVREGINQAQRNDTKEAQIDVVLVDRRMFIDFKTRLDAKERILANSNEGLRSYGFKDVFQQDGVDVSTEYGVPNGCGYGLSIDNVELRCMEDTLFIVEGPVYDVNTQAYKYVVSTLANLRFRSPRNFFFLKALA